MLESAGVCTLMPPVIAVRGGKNTAEDIMRVKIEVAVRD